MKRLAALAIGLSVLLAAYPASSQKASNRQAEKVKIRIVLPDTAIMATLENNAAAMDFVALLPLEVTLKDYASTEKVADLPKKLSTKDAPAGIDPSVGDITYYAPWGNLAIFYKDFGYATGLVKLGTIDANVQALERPGPIKARIERVAK